MALTIGSVTFHEALNVQRDNSFTAITVNDQPIATFNKGVSEADLFNYLTVTSNALMAYDRTCKKVEE